jgi:hypothetical protein
LINALLEGRVWGGSVTHVPLKAVYLLNRNSERIPRSLLRG